MKVSSFQPMNVYEGQVRPTDTPAPIQDQEGAFAAEIEDAEIISQDEKQYFSKLYPNDSKSITSYSTYTKNGVAKDYSVGSLIDQKS